MTVAGLGANDLALVAEAATIRKRVIRFAHLTDVHVEPELAADQGMAACLQHVQAQPDAPEFLLFGGDCVFDSMAIDATRTGDLWDLWKRVLKDSNSLSTEFCIGNHDVFGWTKTKSKATGQEANYGKAWALEMLGLSKSYRSFEKAGWHFIVLDSIHPLEDHYMGRLDDEQMAWLVNDLNKVSPTTPVLILSHIPIFSVTSMLGPKTTGEANSTVISSGSMHSDWRDLRALFRKHPNVKLCLSGHTHLIDRVDSAGVTYICDGAVSGDWWKGNHLGECEPGYGMLDLYDDGTFDHQYVTYGWKTRSNG